MPSHDNARSAYPCQRWQPKDARAQAKHQVAIDHRRLLTSRFEIGYALRAFLCEHHATASHQMRKRAANRFAALQKRRFLGSFDRWGGSPQPIGALDQPASAPMGPIGANVQPNEPGERRERFDGGILRLAEHCVGVLRAVRAVAVLGHRETPAEPSVSMQSRLFPRSRRARMRPSPRIGSQPAWGPKQSPEPHLCYIRRSITRSRRRSRSERAQPRRRLAQTQQPRQRHSCAQVSHSPRQPQR